jgi:hypothetical protein
MRGEQRFFRPGRVVQDADIGGAHVPFSTGVKLCDEMWITRRPDATALSMMAVTPWYGA